jgi:hypothetical protein
LALTAVSRDRPCETGGMSAVQKVQTKRPSRCAGRARVTIHRFVFVDRIFIFVCLFAPIGLDLETTTTYNCTRFAVRPLLTRAWIVIKSSALAIRISISLSHPPPELAFLFDFFFLGEEEEEERAQQKEPRRCSLLLASPPPPPSLPLPI